MNALTAVARSALAVLAVLGSFLGFLAAVALLLYALARLGFTPGLPLTLLLLAVYGWAVYAFFSYRQGRQAELLRLITTAVAADVPLPPVVRAYLRDRPHGRLREFWVAAALLALPGYYWAWHRRHSFDARAARFADRLEAGDSLTEAFARYPALASAETRLAAAVGEKTGRLASCLQRVQGERFAAAWLGLIPRVLYPVLLLLFVFGITSFLMLAIMPKFRRILDEFGMALPPATARLLAAWEWAQDNALLIAGGVLGVVVLVATLVAVPAVRWYFPVVGRFYRWDVQGTVLRMLGALTDAGETAPDALRLLAASREFPAIVRFRLHAAARSVERGEPLADALRRAGLLPGPMASLVQASERALTLPWALRELGDALAGRSLRAVTRLSYLVSPAMIVAVGSVVGAIGLGMFLPLVNIISGLAE